MLTACLVSACDGGDTTLGEVPDEAKDDVPEPAVVGWPRPAPPLRLRPPPSVVIQSEAHPGDPGPWRHPLTVDFQTVRPDCGLRIRPLVVENLGAASGSLAVLAVTPPFAVHPSTRSLERVPGGGEIRLEVFFEAPAPGTYEGAIDLLLEGQTESVRVPLIAAVEADHEVVDAVVSPLLRGTDVLLVVDDSPSMADNWDAVEANLRAFFELLTTWDLVDFRIALTSGRFGQETPSDRPVRFAEVDRSWVRTDEVDVLLGQLRASNYLKTTPARAFLRAAAEVHQSQGTEFRRPEAYFVVVVISDDDDNSPGAVSEYVQSLSAVTKFGFPFSGIMAVTGPSPGTAGARNAPCQGDGGSGRGGPRLIHAADLSWGAFGSICAPDWSRSLEPRVSVAFPSRWGLSRSPRSDTIRVFVDGVELPQKTEGQAVNWIWASATQTINFVPFTTPEPGARLEFRYVATCT